MEIPSYNDWYISWGGGGCYCAQGRLTVNYRYTHRKFQLKFSALLKDYDLKYAEHSKKILLNHATNFNIS